MRRVTGGNVEGHGVGLFECVFAFPRWFFQFFFVSL